MICFVVYFKTKPLTHARRQAATKPFFLPPRQCKSTEKIQKDFLLFFARALKSFFYIVLISLHTLVCMSVPLIFLSVTLMMKLVIHAYPILLQIPLLQV